MAGSVKLSGEGTRELGPRPLHSSGGLSRQHKDSSSSLPVSLQLDGGDKGPQGPSRGVSWFGWHSMLEFWHGSKCGHPWLLSPVLILTMAPNV